MLGNRGLTGAPAPFHLQAFSSLSLERPSRVWAPPIPVLSLTRPSSLTGAPWGAMGRQRGQRRQTAPQHPAPHGTGEPPGTISGVLKEPPGFAHLTENKRAHGGHWGFVLRFFSASSLVGEQGAFSSTFPSEIFPSRSTQHRRTCPQEAVLHRQVNSPASGPAKPGELGGWPRAPLGGGDGLRGAHALGGRAGASGADPEGPALMAHHSPGPVRTRWGAVTWCAGVGTGHPVPSPLPPRARAQRVGSVGCPSPLPSTSRRGEGAAEF